MIALNFQSPVMATWVRGRTVGVVCGSGGEKKFKTLIPKYKLSNIKQIEEKGH